MEVKPFDAYVREKEELFLSQMRHYDALRKQRNKRVDLKRLKSVSQGAIDYIAGRV